MTEREQGQEMDDERRIGRLKRLLSGPLGPEDAPKTTPLSASEVAEVKAAFREFYEGLDAWTRAVLT